jgi:hypothetical protein
MKPVPARQRRQAHRQRKAFARALHQIRAIYPKWRSAFSRWDAGRGPKPARIKVPKLLKRRKGDLYRAVVGLTPR